MFISQKKAKVMFEKLFFIPKKCTVEKILHSISKIIYVSQIRTCKRHFKMKDTGLFFSNGY